MGRLACCFVFADSQFNLANLKVLGELYSQLEVITVVSGPKLTVMGRSPMMIYPPNFVLS